MCIDSALKVLHFDENNCKYLENRPSYRPKKITSDYKNNRFISFSCDKKWLKIWNVGDKCFYERVEVSIDSLFENWCGSFLNFFPSTRGCDFLRNGNSLATDSDYIFYPRYVQKLFFSSLLSFRSLTRFIFKLFKIFLSKGFQSTFDIHKIYEWNEKYEKRG